MLNIFLADDHLLVREGIKNLITAQPDMHVVGEADGGAQALQKIHKSLGDVIDVLVTDIAMPNGNGVETTATLRHTFPHIKILALSMHEEKSYLREIFEAGAMGYVLKRSVADELIRAIRIVASGEKYFDPSIAAKLKDALSSKSPVQRTLAGMTLSAREEETLRLIAQGFANKEIAEQLGVSVKTIETYRMRGMEKLEVSSRARLVRYAVEHNWLGSD